MQNIKYFKIHYSQNLFFWLMSLLIEVAQFYAVLTKKRRKFYERMLPYLQSNRFFVASYVEFIEHNNYLYDFKILHCATSVQCVSHPVPHSHDTYRIIWKEMCLLRR